MMKVLVLFLVIKVDEIVVVSGGMFYGCEVLGVLIFVEQGDYVEVGQFIYIIEVMKMFNKVVVLFVCIIDKVLLENVDGFIVKQGQLLFKVMFDEIIVEENLVDVMACRVVCIDVLLIGLIQCVILIMYV